MIGQCYINNQDMFKTWGASLVRGAYEAILTPAPLKAFIENKFRTEHGTRVIPNNPKIEERTVSISIFIEGKDETDYLQKYESFVQELYKGVIRMRISKLKKEFNFLYDGCTKYGDYGLMKGKFTLKLREPNPDNRINL